MLNKRLRLPIQSVVSRPHKSIRSSGLMLKVFASHLPYGRFGVIIPKTVVKTAVLRNKLKRAAFDAFTPYSARFIERDILCVLSKGGPLTKDGMISEICALFNRLLTN